MTATPELDDWEVWAATFDDRFGGRHHPPRRRRVGIAVMVGVSVCVIALTALAQRVVVPATSPAGAPDPVPTSAYALPADLARSWSERIAGTWRVAASSWATPSGTEPTLTFSTTPAPVVDDGCQTMGEVTFIDATTATATLILAGPTHQAPGCTPTALHDLLMGRPTVETDGSATLRITTPSRWAVLKRQPSA